MAFFSLGLNDYDLNYSFIKKHVLVVIKSLILFRYMLFKNKVKLLVSHPSVKEFLLNKDLNRKRVGWATKVM